MSRELPLDDDLPWSSDAEYLNRWLEEHDDPDAGRCPVTVDLEADTHCDTCDADTTLRRLSYAMRLAEEHLETCFRDLPICVGRNTEAVISSTVRRTACQCGCTAADIQADT